MIHTELLETLKGLVNGKNVIIGEDIGADYTHDEYPGGAAYLPDAVVEANQGLEEIAAREEAGEEMAEETPVEEEA